MNATQICIEMSPLKLLSLFTLKTALLHILIISLTLSTINMY